MRKHKIKLLLFLSILLSILIYACENENDQENSVLRENIYDSEIIDTKKINNLSGYYGNEEIFLTGKFKITETNRNQLVVYTETDKFMHIFLFEGFNKSTEYANMDVEKLYYLKNGILLNNKYYLSTESHLDLNLKKDLNMFTDNNVVIESNTSKMLIHKWFSKDDPNYKEMDANELINFTTKRFQRYVLISADDCEHGGEGSTSCSVTSSTGSGCSVSCGSGYYACCNETLIGTNDCHCEPNG